MPRASYHTKLPHVAQKLFAAMKEAHVVARFAYFTGSCYILASIGYFLLHFVMPRGWVFGALYRMFLYHWEHPYQYILIVAMIYGFLATMAAISCRERSKALRWSIFPVMAMTLVIASPIGGVLWVIHDMQAGFFAEGERFWSQLFWGAATGIKCGWLVVLYSMPYNLFGLAIGYYVTRFGFDLVKGSVTRGILDENNQTSI